MTASPLLILYSFRRCPYAMRARLALMVSRTPCEIREVSLRAKPPQMLAASPKGTVPILVLPDGKVIDESIDIMVWALSRSDPEDWLSRHDDMLVAANDGPFKHDLDRYKYPDRYGLDPLRHRDRGLEFLRELDARLVDTDQLCGPARGLTDAAILPFVRQFAAVDRPWFDALPLPRLQIWLAAHLSSDLFVAIMRPLTRWSQDDASIPPQSIDMDQPR